MAITLEQVKTGSDETNVATCSIGSALSPEPSTGDCVIVCGSQYWVGSGDTFAVTTPSGFSQAVYEHTSTDIGGHISYNLWENGTDGTAITQTSGRSRPQCLAALHYSGLLSGSDPLDVFTSTDFVEASTWSTGATGAVAENGSLAVAVFAVQSISQSRTPSYTAGWSEVAKIQVPGSTSKAEIYIATKLVDASDTPSCSLTLTGSVSRGCGLIAVFKPADTGANPVLTVPSAQAGEFGASLLIEGFSGSDADSDIDSIVATCDSIMTATFDLSSTSVTDGSTNGSAAVTLEGSHAELLTVLGRGITVNHAEIFPTTPKVATLTIRLIDAMANEDEDTVAVTWTPDPARYQVLTGTPSAIITALQSLSAVDDASGEINVYMLATTDEPLTDSELFSITVQGSVPIVNVPATQSAQYDVTKSIGSVSVSHADSLTTSLLFQCHAAMSMTFSAGVTGATITGNASPDVLIEDTHADLNTVAATLQVDRATPVTPVPSNLNPNSLNTYSVETNFQVNDVAYTDRAYVFQGLPSYLLGATWISTPNDDKAESAPATLAFDLNAPAWVYLTLDSRFDATSTFPAWLEDWEFVVDTVQINSSGTVDYLLFRKSFQAGTVTLGGYDFGSLYSHYSVIILPIDASIPVTVTATDSSGNTDVETFDVVWSETGFGGTASNSQNIYRRRRRSQ